MHTHPQNDEWIISLVGKAIESYEKGEVEGPLSILSQCENDLMEDADREYINHHLLFWTQLQHSAILRETGMIRDAALVIENAYETARRLELLYDKAELNTYFLVDFLTISLERAIITAQLGNYWGAVQHIQDILKITKRHGSVLSGELGATLVHLVDKYGKMLGYTELAKRLGLDAVIALSVSQEGIDLERGTTFPIPILGEKFKEFNEAFDNASQRFYSSGTDAQSVRAAQVEITACAQEWSIAFPHSGGRRFIYARLLLESVMMDIEAGEFAMFSLLWPTVSTITRKIAETNHEDIDMLCSVAQSLRGLAGAIVVREGYSEEETSTYYKIAAECAATAANLLNGIGTEFPVTQAVALEFCRVMSVSAALSSAAGDSDASRSLRKLRDAVLSEVLARDPSNDQALALTNKYKSSSERLDGTIIEEIRTWTWRVTPFPMSNNSVLPTNHTPMFWVTR